MESMLKGGKVALSRQAIQADEKSQEFRVAMQQGAQCGSGYAILLLPFLHLAAQNEAKKKTPKDSPRSIAILTSR